MLSIAENIGGKTTLHDLHNLKLGGVFAHTLPGDALFRQLRAAKVEGIDPSLGKQDLLLAYSKHIKEREAAVAKYSAR